MDGPFYAISALQPDLGLCRYRGIASRSRYKSCDITIDDTYKVIYDITDTRTRTSTVYRAHVHSAPPPTTQLQLKPTA